MDFPKVANVVSYAAFFFLLLLLALPFVQISNFFVNLPDWTTIMMLLFSAVSFIVLVLGSNFSMLNLAEVWPRKGERVFAGLLGVVTWYLFFSSLFGSFLTGIYISILIFILITIFLFILTRKYSAKSIGIVIILPFSIRTFIYLFLYNLTKIGSLYGYFYGVLGTAIELTVVITLISLEKRRWANYAVSSLFIGTAIYGILLEGEYFNNIVFYIGSFVALLVSLMFINLLFSKTNHRSFSQFFEFGKNATAGRLLLVLVVSLFIVGFYLIVPFSDIRHVNSYMSYALVLIFAGAIFYFMNSLSPNKVTDAITFILLGGVAIYGLKYLVYITPSSIIGGLTPRYTFWFILSLLIMYEPSFFLTNYIVNNKIDQNFSITHLVGRWKKRSKLLKGKNGLYDISQSPFNKGGTANIYQAYDVDHGRDVIIKIPVIICKNDDSRYETIPNGSKCAVCGADLDTQDFIEAIKILKDEIDALSFLNSPYIVKQLDHFEWGGKTYLVEEKVKGKSFRDEFENAPGDEGRVLDLIKKALYGINHAHMRGIIHRDLNPGNLMVTNTDEVKVIDFGTAKFKSRVSMSKGRISVGGKFGTEYFSPPESYYLGFITNKEPAFSYDIYSLGCIMYMMYTGKVPAGLDVKSVAQIYPGKLFREDFKGDLSSRCSKPVLDIILKATSYYPENRYQSAFEMICAIEKRSGEFLVTGNDEVFSLSAPKGQPFSAEININFKRNISPKAMHSFNAVQNSIDIDLQSGSKMSHSIRYALIFDPNLNQYELIPGNNPLYYWYFDKNGKLIQKQALSTGIFLGGWKIMLFAPTKDLKDVALAYYRVI
ncbi:MAG: serine/threonine-protein kinase [Conexivisphaerales archaeon]